MRTRLRVVVALPILLVAGGTMPVGAQADASNQESRRRCQPAQWPKKLPVLDAVLDSAALAAALSAAPQGDGTSLLLSIVYREGGAPAVRVLEPALPLPPALAPIIDVVSGGLRSVKAPDRAGAVRLRVRVGAGGIARVERSSYCPPQPAPGGMTGPERVRVVVGPGDRLPAPDQRRVRMEAEVIIDEAGHVADVRLIVGSGLRELDEHFVHELRQPRFLPATLDGLPLASWVRTSGRRMQL